MTGPIETDPPHAGSGSRTGVLLVQIGTPDEPTTPAVRRYLRDFLSDPRVVDLNPWLWKPILHGIILRTRPARSAEAYKRVWTDEGSPLLVHSRAQQAGVGARLGPDVPVELGMMIGTPSARDALDRLMDLGCARVVVLPMFPQYSSATNAAALDVYASWARGRRNLPGLTFVRSFPDHPLYIEALRQTVVDAGVEATADAPLVMSFHGLPQRYVDTGDPYPDECARTASALASALDLPSDAWQMVFQSRFGREPWLQPYAVEAVAALARNGTAKIAVITPSFVADCLETIDEIGHELAHTFTAAGGKTFVRVPCINASDAACAALAAVLRDAGL